MNVRPPGDNDSSDPAPCDVLPLCPICDGRMESVYERSHQKVCQCVDCGCSLTVPADAWDIAARKQAEPPAA